jgi:hypothetical protein
MDEPTNPADIVSLMTFDEPLSYDGLTRSIADRLLKHERFKQRVAEVDGHRFGRTTRSSTWIVT